MTLKVILYQMVNLNGSFFLNVLCLVAMVIMYSQIAVNGRNINNIITANTFVFGNLGFNIPGIRGFHAVYVMSCLVNFW